ncbi:uncharacterized protein [Nicotiana sylvestris]|uniref:uncharacterized protein n=1 Tax=Nicotiana sylvestris TaxID=4096 RepID=UPI00388C52C4
MSGPPRNWEGQSTARPPLFNVIDGPLATTKKNVEGVDIPKTRADCTVEVKKWEKNAKAKKCLVCGPGPDEYKRIQSCTTAKEIWDTLQVAHDGTPQEGETIQEMYTRFTTLRNELKSLGRIILEENKVEKILTRANLENGCTQEAEEFGSQNS